MNITRNVILDLLPLYLADEVSADTRALVEEFLKSDPDLANAAKKLAPLEKPQAASAPISRDIEMEAYRKAKRRQFVTALVIGGALAVAFWITVAIFFLTPP